MGIFGKKDITNSYEEAQNELNSTSNEKASERIAFGEIDGNNDHTVAYVEQMRNGHPLVINFDRVEIAEANKALWFISGATYAFGGRVVKIDEKIYMFGKAEDFLDGTLFQWIEDLKNN